MTDSADRMMDNMSLSDDEDEPSTIAERHAVLAGMPVEHSREDEFLYDSHFDTNDEHKYIRCVSKLFAAHGKKPFIILAVTIGLPEYEDLLDSFPFSELKKKHKALSASYIPNGESLKFEIMRRAHFFLNEIPKNEKDHPLKYKNNHVRMPQPSNWKQWKCVDWLKQRPAPLDGNDKRFLSKKINQYRVIVSELLEENAVNEQTMNQAGSSRRHLFAHGWGGIIPWVRLAHIFSEDEFRAGFLTKDDALTREELDAYNTVSAKPDYWELVMQKYNDRNYRPTSICLLDWHEIFTDSLDLSWENLDTLRCFPLLKPEDAKQKFRELNNQLGTIFQNWKASGNGEGMVDLLEEREEPLSNDEMLDLPSKGGNRCDFLGSKNPAVMYLWYVLLSNGIFQTALTELETSYQGNGTNVPDVLYVRSKGEGNAGASTTASETFMEMVNDQGERLIQALNRNIEKQEVRDKKRDIRDQILDLKSDITMLEVRLNNLTNLKHNQTELRAQYAYQLIMFNSNLNRSIEYRESNKKTIDSIQALVDEHQKSIFDTEQKIVSIEAEIEAKKMLINELKEQYSLTDVTVVQSQPTASQATVTTADVIDRPLASRNSR